MCETIGAITLRCNSNRDASCLQARTIAVILGCWPWETIFELLGRLTCCNVKEKKILKSKAAIMRVDPGKR